MKSIFTLLISLQLLVFFEIKAQNDTIGATNADLDSKRHYLNLNFREEKRIFKIGLSPINNIDNEKEITSGSIGVAVAYEHKVIPCLSFIIGSNFDYLYKTDKKDESTYWIWDVFVGTRFYYSMNRRIRMSEGANNFHGNYWGLSLNKSFSTSIYTNESSYKSTYNSDMLSVNFQWGIQRRLGKLWYFDFSPFIGFYINRKNEYMDKVNYGAKLALGLAWGGR